MGVLGIVEWIHEEGMDPETVATQSDLADVYRALADYDDTIEEVSTWRDRRGDRIREGKRDQPESATETT